MSYLKTFKFLSIYLAAVFILAIALNLFLQNYSKANYNETRKEELLATSSKFRYSSASPCANYIYGDPDVSDNYIKVHIHCGDATSTNTLALKAIHPSTYARAIQILGRVNSFETEISANNINRLGSFTNEEKSWHCFKDNVEINDFNKDLQPKDTIDCFYN